MNHPDTQEPKCILEISAYKNPAKAFFETIENLQIPKEIRFKLNEYIQTAFQSNPKEPKLQDLIKPILEALIALNYKEQAGVIFNFHRALSSFRGYSPNDNPSSDVPACFGDDFEIPEKGAIVIRGFLFRNLSKIVKICQNRGIDLSRIRAIETKGFFALQTMLADYKKKHEFEKIYELLSPDQFIIEPANHIGDIEIEENVAVDFYPRIAPIYPNLHKNSEEETIQAYEDWFKDQLINVIEGGRVFAHAALTQDGEWGPLDVETVEGRRTLTKLTSAISDQVALEILKVLAINNFSRLEKGQFLGMDRDPKLDHTKQVKSLHLRKNSSSIATH
ncbi:hypothetical protein ACFL21_05020 [Patescibacteria group bacterium]